MKWPVIILLSLLSSCEQLKYIADTAFLSGAQAGALEFPVSANGSVCKDLTGKVGFCALNIKRDKSINLKMPSRPYAYRLIVNCSNPIVGGTWDVPKKETFSFSIADYKELNQFQCVGEVFPMDRENKVSSKFGIFVKLIDHKYLGRENIFKAKGHLVLGSHSKYVTTPKGHKKKKTYMKIPKSGFVFTESEVGRFNYWGL